MAIISNHTCQSLRRLKEKHINYTRHKNSQKNVHNQQPTNHTIIAI